MREEEAYSYFIYRYEQDLIPSFHDFTGIFN